MTRSLRPRSLGAAVLLGAWAVAVGPAVAWAAPEGRIQEVRSAEGEVTFILSAQGLAEGESIDPGSVTVTLAGDPVTSTAAPLNAAASPGERQVMLALDASGSMKQDDRIKLAKAAARQYLSSVPADVKVGLISFADAAEVAVKPTTDRRAVVSAVNRITADGSTALNDAVVKGVAVLGRDGSRNIVLLSDGEDEGSRATAAQARRALGRSGVVLDAVSMGKGSQEKQLAAFAQAGNGTLVTATDAAGLSAAFQEAARAVGTQLAVTAAVPAGLAGTVELVASAKVGDTQISDTTATPLVTKATPTPTPVVDYGPVAVQPAPTGVLDQQWFLIAVISAVFVALATITSVAIGAVDSRGRQQGRVSRRLQEVSLMGPAPSPQREQPTVLGDSSAVRRAVSFAERVAATRDTTAIARRLEEANLSLRPGEWVVVHSLIAVLAGLLATLFSNLNLLISSIAFALGLLVPWMYLGHLASKRRAQFYESLPDAMQMLAGSLSAGYSLPQALDNVAREHSGPLGDELNRALLESRLGLPIEETLEAVAQRMQSRDFHWVVMAIRINRQVGGNLGEVLTNVGKTLRERERLRRQVKTLSAEGKLSAWILGLLPILLIGYMLLVRPEYITPLFVQPIGWVILGAGLIAYIFGIVWMRNLINMEV